MANFLGHCLADSRDSMHSMAKFWSMGGAIDNGLFIAENSPQIESHSYWISFMPSFFKCLLSCFPVRWLWNQSTFINLPKLELPLLFRLPWTRSWKLSFCSTALRACQWFGVWLEIARPLFLWFWWSCWRWIMLVFELWLATLLAFESVVVAGFPVICP